MKNKKEENPARIAYKRYTTKFKEQALERVLIGMASLRWRKI
jgi:hypothetical protein